MRNALAGAVLALALVAAGCGGSSTGSVGPPSKPAQHGAHGSNGQGDGATITIARGTPSVGNSGGKTALPDASQVAELLQGIPQNGLVLGYPDAPVTLIEYIDLQCPVCQQFETTELAPLVAKYVRTRKIKIALQPWAILDRAPGEHDSLRGQEATIAAAAQNKAFQFAEVLYDNQGTEDSGWMNDATISSIAASVDGLKPYQLATDASGSATKRVIASITSWADNHPTQMLGTPTLYLENGNAGPKYFGTGEPTLGSLEDAIDGLLGSGQRAT